LVAQALSDLAGILAGLDGEILLTLNRPEPLPQGLSGLPYPVRVIANPTPKGFGANHNAAFRQARGQWFCVMNPDIRLPENPFPILLDALTHSPAALVAPAVLSPAGRLEDNIRRFPTPLSLAVKCVGRGGKGRYPFALGDPAFPVDWVAGMFMLFRTEDFRALGGFDEGFFLYYEDVDICARLWRAGRRVLACPRAYIVHDARRASRSQFRHMRWHAASMGRYFFKHLGRLP
jgi:GT2 family glycosyltransferase